MNWETLYCPNPVCPYYGRPWAEARLVKNGAGHGYPQARCRACCSSVNLRYGTAYADLHADPAVFDTAVRALAEGNSLRSTARIVQIDKDTACAWLDRAAHQARLVMLYLWHQLPITECQLDELWSFVHTKEANLETAKLACAQYGDAWIWLAVAPAWRLVVAFVVGKRTQAQANLLLRRVAHVSAGPRAVFHQRSIGGLYQRLVDGIWCLALPHAARHARAQAQAATPPAGGLGLRTGGQAARTRAGGRGEPQIGLW